MDFADDFQCLDGRNHKYNHCVLICSMVLYQASADKCAIICSLNHRQVDAGWSKLLELTSMHARCCARIGLENGASEGGMQAINACCINWQNAQGRLCINSYFIQSKFTDKIVKNTFEA